MAPDKVQKKLQRESNYMEIYLIEARNRCGGREISRQKGSSFSMEKNRGPPTV
jgi:hypothetical protein